VLYETKELISREEIKLVNVIFREEISVKNRIIDITKENTIIEVFREGITIFREGIGLAKRALEDYISI
jgi:hypothetical protein